MSDEINDWHKRKHLALLTDFYQLTMSAGQLKEGRANEQACFEYIFRSLPPHSGFAVAAGLESFLDYLEHLQFDESDLAYLQSLNTFDDAFLEHLRGFRSTCCVRAIPEGTLVFPYEPVVQVQGTIFEVQLLETALLNFLNYQTLIATKAARICLAAEGDPVLEFGLRRAHGPDGALSGSRAAYIGGCTSTSNVLAGKIYGIPVEGTHAHSWVMSYPSELEAFRAFARLYPERCILLVDTYDTIASGVPNAIRAFSELRDQGRPVRAAIRLDSGDLSKLSKLAHAMMVDAGFEDPLIVASNDLEEDLIADLKRQGAKINSWGVGTQLITSHDSPALNGVYKLVALEHDGEWRPRIKISSNPEKATDPGRKRVLRHYNEAGQPLGDILYGRGESLQDSGTPEARIRNQPQISTRLRGVHRSEDMLQTVFENGQRRVASPPLVDIRTRARDQIASIPDEYKRLRNPHRYDVLLSRQIGDLKTKLLLDTTNAGEGE